MSNSYYYSKLQVAHDCLRKYKLQFIDEIKTPEELSGDLAFGTAIHTAINAAFFGGSAVSAFTALWQELKTKPLEYTRFKHQDLGYLGVSFMDRFERLHLKNFEVQSFDERLFGELGGFKLEGTPDFIGNYKGTFSIVDFKTSKDVYDPRKIQTNEQMHIYAHLYNQQHQKYPDALTYVVFAKMPSRISVITKPFDFKQHKEIMKNVSDTILLLESSKLFPQNRNACFKGATITCPYYNHCHGEAING